MTDFYMRDGCCFGCVECGDCDKPCFECKCSKCSWYDTAYDPKCTYPTFKTEMETIEVEIIKETEKAVLLHASPYNDKWFPLSQIEFDSDTCVRIPRWLEESNGWVCEDDWFELNGLKIKEYEESRERNSKFRPDRWAQYYG